MRSMTGYGRGETDHDGTKFTVELNSVNRKQSDVVINLPRDLIELEPRIRQTINENISRGRTNATVSLHSGANGARPLVSRSDARVAKGIERPRRDHHRHHPASARRNAVSGRSPESRRYMAGRRRRSACRARRSHKNARTRGQTSCQGFDSPSQSNSKKTQGSPDTASRRGETVSHYSARSNPKSRAAAG